MNEEIKKQWIADLRDGARTQGQDCLRNEMGDQCCLDVLMEQAVRAGVIEKPVFDDKEKCYGYQKFYEGDEEYEEYGYQREYSCLTDKVVEWAGLDFVDPFVNYPGDMEVTSGPRTLSACNDFLKLDFPTISNLIEDQL